MPLQPLLLETDLSIIVEREVSGLIIFSSTLAVFFDDLHKLAYGLRGLRLFFLHRSAIILIEQIPDRPSFLQIDWESC